MATMPNQEIIIVSKAAADRDHPYTVINLEALDFALATLKGSELALWIYIAKNQNKYSFALSCVDFCRKTAFSSSSYHRAVMSLKEKGYLVKKENAENIYIFYEGGTTVPSKDDIEIEIPQIKQDQINGFSF